jgi:hypothetical protein
LICCHAMTSAGLALVFRGSTSCSDIFICASDYPFSSCPFDCCMRCSSYIVTASPTLMFNTPYTFSQNLAAPPDCRMRRANCLNPDAKRTQGGRWPCGSWLIECRKPGVVSRARCPAWLSLSLLCAWQDDANPCGVRSKIFFSERKRATRPR